MRHRHKPEFRLFHDILHPTSITLGISITITNNALLELISLIVLLGHHRWTLTVIHHKGFYWKAEDIK